MFDKDMLADIFVENLNICATYPDGLCPIETKIRNSLIVIFPWLSRFRIRRDGNEMRWRVWDDTVEDSTIVFTTPGEAGEQVRRWIVEHLAREALD